MIIAYPLIDVTSMTNRSKCWQQKGVPCKVVSFNDNMAILENKKGEKFPINKSKIIWADTSSP